LYYPYARATFGAKPAPAVGEFAYRRALKILPSYLLAIAVLSSVGAHFASASDAVRQIALHLFFVRVWFDDSYGSINGVLWSSAIEVQFYLVFPTLAWAARRYAVATFLGLAVIANAYRIAVHGAYDAVHLINQLPGVLDLFAPGMFVAWAYCGVVARFPAAAARRHAWTVLSFAGVAGIDATIETTYGAKLQPEWPSAWLAWGRPGLAAALGCATLGALLAVPAWQRALANPLLVFLSLVSYNLYLWHAAVAHALLDRHIPNWHAADSHGDAAWGLAFTVVAAAAALAVASLVTFAVERPLLRGRPFASQFARVAANVGARRRSPGADGISWRLGSCWHRTGWASWRKAARLCTRRNSRASRIRRAPMWKSSPYERSQRYGPRRWRAHHRRRSGRPNDNPEKCVQPITRNLACHRRRQGREPHAQSGLGRCRRIPHRRSASTQCTGGC